MYVLGMPREPKGIGMLILSAPLRLSAPIDRNLVDANGSRIPDISDRELNTILYEIKRVKGIKLLPSSTAATPLASLEGKGLERAAFFP